ncbi:MAG: thiol reductant ABC exporter subunit CydC [Aquisalimonadaceae bacterium]
MADLWYFLRLYLRRWPWLLAGTALMLTTVAANFGLLALSGWFIAATGLAGLLLAAGGAMTLDIYRPGAGIRFFAVGRAVARYGERLVNHEAVFRMLADLRVWFFRALLVLDAGRLAALRDGELLNRITADVDAMDHLFLRVVGPTLVAIIGLLAGVGFVALWAPDVALWVGLILIITALFTTLATGVRGIMPARRLAETASLLRERAVGDLQAIAELRIYGAMEERLNAWMDIDRQQAHARLKLGRQAAFATFAMSASGQLALWAAAFTGAGLYAGGRISGPVLAMLLLAVLALAELLAPLPSAWQLLARVRWSAARLRALTGGSPAVADPEQPEPPPRDARVELANVSFRHRTGQPWCLQDVDLSVRVEERIAILGPSGTGKSSLLSLLLRQRAPDRGAIRLGGVDLRHLRREDVDTAISHLPQRTVLFSGTVADNLRLACPDADDPRLWNVLQSVALDAFVESLPDGLDTWLGQHGAGLSGGQARRLALARTLLKPAPLVLLDEPTEGLDRATEKRVLTELDRWLVGRTLILIAHDRDRLPPLDRVLRLEDGRFRRI